MLCDSLDGREVWERMDTCKCMAESLCCPSETTTTLFIGYGFSSVQSLSCVQLFATPWIAARQVSLSITNFGSLLKLMSIESMMPSNHLILCCPLLLRPSIFPSIRVFSNESALCIRWLKYWSFSFNISLSLAWELSEAVSWVIIGLTLFCFPSLWDYNPLSSCV